MGATPCDSESPPLKNIRHSTPKGTSRDAAGYPRSFPVFSVFFVRCQAWHQLQRYAWSVTGASAVATWCLAVARAAPSVAYLRLPLTGHLEALSIASFIGDSSQPQLCRASSPPVRVAAESQSSANAAIDANSW